MELIKTAPRIVFSDDLDHTILKLSEGIQVNYPVTVANLQEGCNSLEEDGCGVFIIGPSSRLAREMIAGKKPAVPVIVIAEKDEATTAVQLMKAGAHDVLIMPPHYEQLLHSINSALPGRQYAATDRPAANNDTLIGTSPSMQFVRDMIASVAPSDANVFITGESGTGKELVARALHIHSKRSEKPFIAINCAALPRDILENELFGHERGAFTGATNQKEGCFEFASGGTLFLDEIGETTTETQAKLLRVIEEQSFRRLGGKQRINVDVRIVAATNREVPAALEAGALRMDLYYRLNVVEINLSPLKDRRDDIPLLAHHFLTLFAFKYGKNISGFSREYIEKMQSYAWPGNVRELRNAIERAVVICPGSIISSHDLPMKIQRIQDEIQHISIPIGSTVEEAEKKLILETLASVGNNKARASRILGVSRKTLHNKLNSFHWGTDAVDAAR